MPKKRKKTEFDPETLEDSLFIHLSSGEAEDLFYLHDTNANVKIATQLKKNNLLSGNILWTRKGKPFPAREATYYTKVWTAWLGELIRSCFALGLAIASWSPNALYGNDPLILNPTLVDIYYYQHYTGQTYYRVFEKPNILGINTRRSQGGPVASSHLFGERIYNIHIFEWEKPAANGRYNSRLMDLKNDIAFEKRLLGFTGVAYELLAAPQIITEAETQRHDEYGMRSALSTRAAQRADVHDNDLADYHRTKDANAAPIEMEAGPSQQQIEADLRRTHQMYLGPGRKYVKQNLPVAPAELASLLERHKQRTLEIFGIPYSMLTSEGAKGGNENVTRMFFDSSRQFARRCQADVEEFMNILLLEKHLDEYMAENKDLKEFTEQHAEDAMAAITVTCTMTGLPDDETVDKLYLLGAMTYEQMIQCYGGRYGLDLEGFHPQPKLDLEKANGIKEVEPAKPAKKKKKK